MPGDRPMRRLRDPVRRTVRRLGWAVGAGTRRLGARTWPGAGGRTDSQPRPKQQGNRDPVTLPHPDLPIVLLSHPWAGVVRARRVGPHGQPRRRRTGHGAHRRQCRTCPTPSGYARLPPTRTPLWLASTTTRCSASPWSPSRGSSTRPTCVGAECAGAVGRTAGRDAGCPCHQPRLGREELMALGAFATVAAELVRTGAELVSRIWIEQAKGVLAASQEVTPDEGFQQFRARARSSTEQAGRSGSGGGGAGGTTRAGRRPSHRRRPGSGGRGPSPGRRAGTASRPEPAGPTCRGPGPSPRRPGRTGASRRPERLAGGWRW
jgi:ANTAR domain